MPSLSLQTHLVGSRPQLSPITVDPRGFKLALQSLTKFLIANEVRANLWLKLPKDDAWWTDVWEYGQQAAGSTIYMLGGQTSNLPTNLAASIRPLAINQDEDLKREYLCLAVASNFVYVLLAVRTPLGTSSAGDKRTIKLYCSTAGPAMAALSVGLKHVVEHSLKEQLGTSIQPMGLDTLDDLDAFERADEFSDTLAQPSALSHLKPLKDEVIAYYAVLSQWEQCFPADVLACEALPLTEAFFVWQLQANEELRSQLSTYRSASKSEPVHSLSLDFLSQAGQELQSPLTSIKTALKLLGSSTLKMAQRQLYLEMIGTQCDRQQSLINSIVDLLKVQITANLPPQVIQLADIIPGIVSTYQPIAEEHGIMLAYTIPPHLAAVLTVESDLKEVVIRLINNGLQATPREGRVWVSATPHDAHFIALTVQDSGAGMSKADSAKLFDAFYRHATSGEGNMGSGLGLTLVQQLVKRMGGSISVESVPSRGTSFKILLPIHQTEASARHSSIDMSQGNQRQNILRSEFSAAVSSKTFASR